MTSLVGDMGPCIDSIASSYTVTRTTTATVKTKGRAAEPTTTTLTIKGVIQPINGRERKLLPENIRDGEVKKIYVSDANALQGVDVVGKVRADRIAADGFNYVVQSVVDWETLGGYDKYLLVKVNA